MTEYFVDCENLLLEEDRNQKEEDNERTWTCQYCVENGLWGDKSCHTTEMCRYMPEIYLIQHGLLKSDQVLFGEWNPEYKLKNGESLILKNEKQVEEAYRKVEEKFPASGA